MPQQRASFIYTLLKYGETRLLQQSMDADAVVWFLNTVWLHDRDVDALSSTWRDQSHTLSFVCNAQEPLIHQSLKDALRVNHLVQYGLMASASIKLTKPRSLFKYAKCMIYTAGPLSCGCG